MLTRKLTQSSSIENGKLLTLGRPKIIQTDGPMEKWRSLPGFKIERLRGDDSTGIQTQSTLISIWRQQLHRLLGFPSGEACILIHLYMGKSDCYPLARLWSSSSDFEYWEQHN